MRKLKFRAWDRKYKRWQSLKTAATLLVSGDSESVELHSDNLAIMQYTGLKDKNGVEVYEGDIVSLPGYASRKTIEWGCTSADGEAFGYENIDTEDAVVIGNIYENPGLVKSKS